MNAELLKKFQTHLKNKQRSTSTIKAYTKDIEQLSTYLKGKSYETVDSKDIQSFLLSIDAKKSSKKTLSRKLNSINTFYKFLNYSQIIQNNPSTFIEHPKFKSKSPRILKKEEYVSIREYSKSNPRLFVMIEFLLQTGIKISELSMIRLADIDLSERVVNIPTGSSSRKVPLNDKIYFVLKDYISNISLIDLNLPLFKTKTNKPMQIRNIRSSIDKIILKAKVKNACVNDIRNTFIVCQLNAGLKIEYVAEIVGHSTLSSTKRYLDCLEKKYKEKETHVIVEL